MMSCCTPVPTVDTTMARRRGDGLFDSLVRMPWPAGVAFGVLGFAAVRWGIAYWLGAAGGPIGKGVAKLIQSGALAPFAWLVLGVGLLAAGLSYWRAGDRARLLDAQKSERSVQALTWKQFEQLVGEAFRRRGYRVEETGQGGADGGIDLLLTRDGETTLVQCKHWRSRHVGVSVVREMVGLMAHHGAAAGKIVCTGVFSSDCYRFAVGKPVELLDGEAVYKLIADVRADTMVMPPAPVASPEPVATTSSQGPGCPQCGSPMVVRANRTSGERFWGCPRYPACRGTLPLQ
jgi:restriction system protein